MDTKLLHKNRAINHDEGRNLLVDEKEPSTYDELWKWFENYAADRISIKGWHKFQNLMFYLKAELPNEDEE